MGLKKDYVGSMIVVQYNRAGDIFRKITFKDVFPTGQPDFVDELSYETPDAADLTMTYRCDHWVEENVGANKFLNIKLGILKYSQFFCLHSNI